MHSLSNASKKPSSTNVYTTLCLDWAMKTINININKYGNLKRFYSAISRRWFPIYINLRLNFTYTTYPDTCTHTHTLWPLYACTHVQSKLLCYSIEWQYCTVRFAFAALDYCHLFVSKSLQHCTIIGIGWNEMKWSKSKY